MIAEPEYMADLVFDPKTHVYRVNGRIKPHITEVVPSDYSHVHPDVLEKAQQRGTAAHKATELYDLGTLNWSKLDPKVTPYLEAWVKAINDYEIEFEPEDVERWLYHPLHGYAGTGDRPRAWIKPPNQKRRLSTVELKTIARMDENVALQTGGQQCAENYRARALGIAETEDRWAFQLRADGTYGKPCHYTDKRHERIFLAYLHTLLWEVEHGKRKFAVQGSRVGASR